MRYIVKNIRNVETGDFPYFFMDGNNHPREKKIIEEVTYSDELPNSKSFAIQAAKSTKGIVIDSSSGSVVYDSRDQKKKKIWNTLENK